MKHQETFMKKYIFILLIALIVSVFAACQATTVEGVWTGVALLVDDGSSDSIEAKLTKAGDAFSGKVSVLDKQGQKTEQPMSDLKIEGQQISFKLGDKTCKGKFSSNNSKLNGKCTADGGENSGGMSFELTKN